MKIVYIIDSLALKGGAERIITEKMNYLATIYNYDVSVITYYQFHEPNTYPLSCKVKQINLSIPFYQQYRYRYPKRLWFKWVFYRRLRIELQQAVTSINPDILIGVGYTLADVVCSIKCQAAKIIESHEARIYTKSPLLKKRISFIFTIYLKLYRKKYLKTVEKKADAIVTLTKDDALEWKNAKYVKIIPNFSIMPISNLSNCESKRVIAVGRLVWQKGYDRLVNIWELVSHKHSDWQLDIFGEGKLEEEINNNIKKKELKNIKIHPFTDTISQEYASSSICVLTSRFEGFSLILLEAMRHGLPCVSFNCPYGPKDLIDDNETGYIIDNNNIEQFAEKLNYLIENTEVRKKFSEEAVMKSNNYNVDNIMNSWRELFMFLHNEKLKNHQTIT